MGGHKVIPSNREDNVAALRPRQPPLPPDLLQLARDLRKDQSEAEVVMWALLRGRRLANKKFRRQHPLGSYVLDFYCAECALAVELDGGQHNTESARRNDGHRTEFLASRGIRVLRFWNNEVLEETECVLDAIWNALQSVRGPS
jgi:type I restriction enzyme M protein